MISVAYKMLLINSLDGISFAMLIVILAPHILQLGATQLFLGSLTSFCSFLNLIWNPIVGSLGDTKGRKFVLKINLLLGLIASLLFTRINYLPLIFIIRCIGAMGSQNAPIVKTLATDLLPKDEQAPFYSKMAALGGFSFLFGPLISGLMSDLENGTYKSFFVISILQSLCLLVIFTLPESQSKAQQKQEKDHSASAFTKAGKPLKEAYANLKNVNWKKFGDLFWIKLCADISLGFFQFNIGNILFLTFGVKGKEFGLIITFISIVGIITNTVLMKYGKTLYEEDTFALKRLYHGAVFLLLTAICATISTNGFSIYFFISSMMPMVITRTLFDPSFTQALVARADPSEKGTAVGVMESIFSFSGLVVPLTTGLISQAFGNSIMLSISIIPAAMAIYLIHLQRVSVTANKISKKTK